MLSAPTLLHVAASGGHKAVVELLLAHKLQTNAKDSRDWTPLHEAAQRDREVIAELQLDAKDKHGWTPLHLAAFEGNKEVVALLLAKKANSMATDKEGRTPLHWAAQRDHKEAAELLLAHGAEVNATFKTGYTPLHSAAHGGSKEVSELLLANKAEIKRCHEVVHQMGAPRISTFIHLGTRTDRTQTMDDKIKSVEAKLTGR